MNLWSETNTFLVPNVTLTLPILAFFRVQSFTLTLNVYFSLSSSFYDCVCVCVLSSFIEIAFALPSNSCLRSVVCWCDVRHDVFCEEYFDFWLSSTQVNRIKQRIEDSRNWVNKKIEQYRDGSKSLSRKQQTKKKNTGKKITKNWFNSKSQERGADFLQSVGGIRSVLLFTFLWSRFIIFYCIFSSYKRFDQE